MDKFFSAKTCDRCGGSLNDGRIMSMYNRDVLCPSCKTKEMKRPDYNKACIAERAAILAGDYNFDGIGLPAEG